MTEFRSVQLSLCLILALKFTVTKQSSSSVIMRGGDENIEAEQPSGMWWLYVIEAALAAFLLSVSLPIKTKKNKGNNTPVDENLDDPEVSVVIFSTGGQHEHPPSGCGTRLLVFFAKTNNPSIQPMSTGNLRSGHSGNRTSEEPQIALSPETSTVVFRGIPTSSQDL